MSAMFSPEEILLQKMKKKRSTVREDNSSELEEKEARDNPSKDNDGDKDKEEEFGHDTNGNDDDDVRDKQEESSSRVATHGFHLVKGKIDHGMEDYIVAENRQIDGHDLGLYAIFDGHSGRQVAEYLQSNLFDNILSNPDFWTSPENAVKSAYQPTDDEILEKLGGSGGGSTAVTAILIDGKKLIVANVGDSRAILCRNSAAKPITVDHEPQMQKDLVESRGGFVSKMPGSVPRVDGQLAMTRTFGDAKGTHFFRTRCGD